MKRLLLILLLILGMSLSFAAIGLVMLFALNVVEDLDEVQALLTGAMPGGESEFVKPEELTKVQDALMLLQQQKGELERDLQQLKDDKGVLEQEKEKLSEEVGELNSKGQVDDGELAKIREDRLAQLVTLYGAMRPDDAAGIFDQIKDNQMVLDILTRLEPRQAAQILNGLQDEQRKADLSQELLEVKTANQ